MNLTVANPIKAAKTERLIVKRAYNEAEKYSPLSIIRITSRENAENVVKPPKNPVIANKRIC